MSVSMQGYDGPAAKQAQLKTVFIPSSLVLCLTAAAARRRLNTVNRNIARPTRPPYTSKRHLTKKLNTSSFFHENYRHRPIACNLRPIETDAPAIPLISLVPGLRKENVFFLRHDVGHRNVERSRRRAVHVIAELDHARFRRHKRRKRSRIDSRHVAVATRKRRLDVNVPAGRRARIVVPARSRARRRRAARIARPIEVVRSALGEETPTRFEVLLQAGARR